MNISFFVPYENELGFSRRGKAFLCYSILSTGDSKRDSKRDSKIGNKEESWILRKHTCTDVSDQILKLKLEWRYLWIIGNKIFFNEYHCLFIKFGP